MATKRALAILVSLAFFIIVMAVHWYVFSGMLEGRMFSDIPAHLDDARRLDYSEITYPLFHLSVLGLASALDLSLERAALLVLVAATACTILVVAIAPAVVSRKYGQVYFFFALASIVVILNPVELRSLCVGTWKVCNGWINSFHSPTQVFARPFGLSLIVGYGILLNLLLSGYNRRSLYAVVLVSMIGIASVFAKPNLGLAFIFAAPLFVLCFIRRLSIVSIVGLAMPVVCVVLVLLAQYFWNYGPSSGGDSGSVVFDFLGVASLVTRSVPLSAFLLVAFPLLASLVFRDLFENEVYQLSFIVFVVALMQYWLLAESGPRYSHGNFGWGMELPLPLMYALSAERVWTEVRKRAFDVRFVFACLFFILFVVYAWAGARYLFLMYKVGDVL